MDPFCLFTLWLHFELPSLYECRILESLILHPARQKHIWSMTFLSYDTETTRATCTRYHRIAVIYYKTKTRQLWDPAFRRNSSLQATWDTSIPRTTGFSWPHQGCRVLVEGNKIWQLWNSVSVLIQRQFVLPLYLVVYSRYLVVYEEKGHAVRIDPRPPSPSTCRLCARSLWTLLHINPTRYIIDTIWSSVCNLYVALIILRRSSC